MSSHSFSVIKGSSSGALSLDASQKRSVAPTEAWVELTHCGLCFTDLHYRTSGQGLGHEGVGIIRELGSAAHLINKTLKVGDRVGMGWMQKYCGYCKPCRTGIDVHCENAIEYGTGNTDQGCFADGIAWDVSALTKVPEGLDSADVGPLMCGGATVWGPLYQYGLRPNMRVGVVGLGGLGHLAVQFAKAMGTDVVVFSGTEDKKEEALKFGASEFVATKGKTSLEGIKPIDFLLVTASGQPDYSQYIDIMAPFGKIFLTTISFDSSPFPMLPWITRGVTVIGSKGTSRQPIAEMLDFAAKHNIKPQTQIFSFSEKEVTEAFNVLESGQMRYRGVITMKK